MCVCERERDLNLVVDSCFVATIATEALFGHCVIFSDKEVLICDCCVCVCV